LNIPNNVGRSAAIPYNGISIVQDIEASPINLRIQS
jgi:hypothetical protein